MLISRCSDCKTRDFDSKSIKISFKFQLSNSKAVSVILVVNNDQLSGHKHNDLLRISTRKVIVSVVSTLRKTESDLVVANINTTWKHKAKCTAEKPKS